MSGRLTRRDVLRGVAVAGATALVDPGGALALSGGRSGVFSRWVGTLTGGATSPIAATRPFSLVGVEWSAPARPKIELRTRSDASWVTASVQGHGPDGPPGIGRQFGEPVWTDTANCVQLRSAGRVEGVRLYFVSAGDAESSLAHAAAVLPLAQPALSAGPGQPPIIARSAWAHGHAPPPATSRAVLRWPAPRSRSSSSPAPPPRRRSRP